MHRRGRIGRREFKEFQVQKQKDLSSFVSINQNKMAIYLDDLGIKRSRSRKYSFLSLKLDDGLRVVSLQM